MITDWMNTEVTGISGIRIEMHNEAKISIFTDNDLTHITDDHFCMMPFAGLIMQTAVCRFSYFLFCRARSVHWFGRIVMRGCALRSLLGSYVHQESILIM